MKHVRTARIPWEVKTGYSKRVLLNGEELGRPGIRVQELSLEPGEVAASHFHRKQTEIFYFPEATGEFIVNGERVQLLPGDVLVIEPNDHHKVRCTGDEEFRYVVFKLDFAEDDSFMTAPSAPSEPSS